MTKEKQMALKLAATVYEAIVEAGEAGIPSGHLYAILMGVVDLNTYNILIGTLTKHGFIKNQGHLLTAEAVPRKENLCAQD